MVWARLDDEMLDNPKIAKAGIYGFAMHVAGIIWCCRNLSDGHIPYARVTSLVTLDKVLIDTCNPLALPDGPTSMGGDDGLDPYVVADHLVDCGLWTRTVDGYDIHDFLDYNPSRAEIESKRLANARKQAKSRDKRKNGGMSPSNLTGVSPVTLPVSSSLPGPLNLALSSPSEFSSSESERSKTATTAPRPGERFVAVDDALPDELRAAAQIVGVRDVDTAWLSFCGKRAGQWLHVAGAWQAFCATWRSIEQREAGSGTRLRPGAAPKQPHTGSWQVPKAVNAPDEPEKR